MIKLDYKKCTEYQLRTLIEKGKTPKICNEAWENYKKQGGNDWFYFLQYGGTPEICIEAWKNYKKQGGNDWSYFSKHGGTPEIRNEAKSNIISISEFINN